MDTYRCCNVPVPYMLTLCSLLGTRSDLFSTMMWRFCLSRPLSTGLLEDNGT